MNPWLWVVAAYICVAITGGIVNAVKLDGKLPAWRFVANTSGQLLLLFCVLKGGGAL